MADLTKDNFEAGKLYNKISISGISDDYEPRKCNEY
jgi:hypothetical protein